MKKALLKLASMNTTSFKVTIEPVEETGEKLVVKATVAVSDELDKASISLELVGLEE